MVVFCDSGRPLAHNEGFPVLGEQQPPSRGRRQNEIRQRPLLKRSQAQLLLGHQLLTGEPRPRPGARLVLHSSGRRLDFGRCRLVT